MTNGVSGISTQIAGLLTQTLGYEALFERLRSGNTVVTGNSRLTRFLNDRYTQWRITQGDHSWPTPCLLSWQQWLDKLWEAAVLENIEGTDRVVPANRQLLSLWQNTLEQLHLAPALLHPQALAAHLRDTRQLLVDWQVDASHPAWFDEHSENHDAFYRWNLVFEKQCRKDNWISPEDRSAVLEYAIDKGRLELPGDVDLLGFDELNPSQAGLLSACSKQRCTITQLSIETRQDTVSLFKCKDEDDELERVARWARYWFEREPESSIAIAVPGLQERRRDLIRHLQEILDPVIHPEEQKLPAWNVSMGVLLASLPMIETAFDLLGLLDGIVDIQLAGRVLRSPWLSGATREQYPRALLEKRLREKHARQFSLRTLKIHAREIRKYDHQHKKLEEHLWTPQPWSCPELVIVIDKLARFAAINQHPRTASDWAESFDHLLASLGWPMAGQATDSDIVLTESEDWQALQSWREVLQELAALDVTTKRYERPEAVRQLRQICQDKIFQPRTPPARIQVLGLYEISGLRFDHLWVLGLHAGNWPPISQPNPFIPYKLQRQVELPNSSPQRELAVAQTITTRLAETAPDCVFSFPGQLDGEDVLPSPLFTNPEFKPVEAVPAWVGDNQRTAVASGEQATVTRIRLPGHLRYELTRGGSSLLKHQALCPFRAFASNRLGAEPLETPPDGISPALHGSLVHKVLEGFWRNTRTQSALLQLDDESLASEVRQHVDQVTSNEVALKERASFKQVEADRIHRHVMQYLDLEKDRETFEVSGLEQEVTATIAGQPIHLFIDRVDTLPNGDEIIIDYKTGLEEPRKWFGNRPENPQLPLYAISASQVPAAVAFGLIREDGCLYKGVVRREGLLPGLPPRSTQHTLELIEAGVNMPQTIDNWRRVLHSLMSDFLAGQAVIDPKQGRNTCDKSYCDLHALCRIGELEQITRECQGETPG